MGISSSAIFLISSFCLVGVSASAPAQAQTISGTPGIALKNGESFELADAYWISSTCNSMLVGTPEVEILDGPPGVTVTVKEAMVTPRYYNCAKPVRGGKVIIAANDIDHPSYTTFTIRYKFKGRDGDRLRSRVYKLSLFP
jgi:hypothetical protein